MAQAGIPVGPRALDLSGRTALVTGGSKGIGAGAAAALVAVGAHVVIVSRDASAGEAVAAEITAQGPGECRHIAGDVADFGLLRRVVNAAANQSGRLDILVNNAVFFPGWQPIDTITDDVIHRALTTNVGAYVVASQAALPYLRRTRGSIVNVSSISGAIGGWHDAVYSATKGAITSFTKALALEEAQNGVRVNAILPGNIVTDARLKSEAATSRSQEFHEFLERWQWLGRSGTVEEVGNAVLFLASEMGSFCTGISLIVSGGVELGYGVKEPYPDFNAPV